MTSGNSKSFVGFRLGGPTFVAALAGAVLAAALGGPAPARAGEEQTTVEEVMAKYIEALGGEAAFQKLHNRVVKGTLGIPAMEMAVKITAYEAEPNRTLVLVESQMGEEKHGTNGEVAWSHNAVSGHRVLEGKERSQALRRATFRSELRWREMYDKVEYLGVEAVDGKACHKLVATPTEGKPETWFFDKESHLKIKTTTFVAGPMGEIAVQSVPSDYRKVDGVLIAHKITNELMGQERVFTIESIEHNVDLPKDRFDLPEEVKSLVAIQKETREAEKAAEKAAEKETEKEAEKETEKVE